MPTEPKHTKGDVEAGQGHPAVIYFNCVPIAHTCNGDGYDWLPDCRFLDDEIAKANAARLVAGWNLLNRLEEMGVDAEQVPELLKVLQNAAFHSEIALDIKIRSADYDPTATATAKYFINKANDMTKKG